MLWVCKVITQSNPCWRPPYFLLIFIALLVCGGKLEKDTPTCQSITQPDSQQELGIFHVVGTLITKIRMLHTDCWSLTNIVPPRQLIHLMILTFFYKIKLNKPWSAKWPTSSTPHDFERKRFNAQKKGYLGWWRTEKFPRHHQKMHVWTISIRTSKYKLAKISETLCCRGSSSCAIKLPEWRSLISEHDVSLLMPNDKRHDGSTTTWWFLIGDFC